MDKKNAQHYPTECEDIVKSRDRWPPMARRGRKMIRAVVHDGYPEDKIMRRSQRNQRRCAVCGNEFPQREVVSGAAVRDTIAELIVHEHPAWSMESFICRPDLLRYSANYVESLLASERGELGSIEKEVIDSLRQHELLAMNVDAESEKTWTLGERMADRLAEMAGSWAFLFGFGVFMAGWIAMNSLVLYWSNRLSDHFSLNFRQEWFNDPEGARILPGAHVSGFTVTPEYRITEDWVVRADFRFDRADRAVFDRTGQMVRQQNTFFLGQSYKF